MKIKPEGKTSEKQAHMTFRMQRLFKLISQILDFIVNIVKNIFIA
jgi:hypothetical protein